MARRFLPPERNDFCDELQRSDEGIGHAGRIRRSRRQSGIHREAIPGRSTCARTPAARRSLCGIIRLSGQSGASKASGAVAKPCVKLINSPLPALLNLQVRIMQQVVP